MNRRSIPLFLFATMMVFVAGAKTFLFIGDSITDGNWGSPQGYPCITDQRNQWDKNHILGHGYVEMIAGELGGENPDSSYYFINRGISGETLYQISSRWDKDVIAHNPDFISLLCGTNDIHYWLEKNPECIEDFDFNKYRQTIDSILDYTSQKLPDAKIVLCTPFVAKVGKTGESPDYMLREEAVDSIASIIRDVVNQRESQKVVLTDFNKLTRTLCTENPDMAYWIWDGIHPTTFMHYRMAKEWISPSFGIITD